MPADAPVSSATHRVAVLPASSGSPLASIDAVSMASKTTLPPLPPSLEQMRNRERLKRMATATQKEMTAQFRSTAFNDRCDAPEVFGVAGRPGLQMRCALERGDETILRQIVVMWETPHGGYSVVYAARAKAFEANKPLFENVLASARIE